MPATLDQASRRADGRGVVTPSGHPREQGGPRPAFRLAARRTTSNDGPSPHTPPTQGRRRDWPSPSSLFVTDYRLFSPTKASGLPRALSTTRRTSPRHHLLEGFVSAHRHIPPCFSWTIRSRIVDLPFRMTSALMSAAV